MGSPSIGDQRLYGENLLVRLANVKLAILKPHIAAFRAAHAAYESAAKRADAARSARDTALAAVGLADDALDAAVLTLANVLVGAGLGDRRNPFQAFSPHGPTRLTELGYADEVKAVEALVAKIGAKKPGAEVKRSLATVSARAAGVKRALAGLTSPLSAFDRARADRDQLLLPWHKALGRLKRWAAAELDDPAAAHDLFAPPERVQSGAKVRRKPATATPAPSSPTG